MKKTDLEVLIDSHILYPCEYRKVAFLALIHSGANPSACQNTEAADLSAPLNHALLVSQRWQHKTVPNSPRSISQFCTQMASLRLQKIFF
jgi:hypothetical protein